MNEQTEALALQAAEYAIKFTVNNPELYIPTLMEKFALLIVRECLTTIKQDRYRHSKDLETDYDDGYVDGLGRAEKILEEHFGVEE